MSAEPIAVESGTLLIGNVRVGDAFRYPSRGLHRHAIVSRDSLIGLARRPAHTDNPNGMLGEQGVRVQDAAKLRSFGAISGSRSPLHKFVALVVGDGPEEQVSRIAAEAIVAGMADEFLVRVDAGTEKVREAVRAQAEAPPAVIEAKRAVPTSDGPGDPKPAVGERNFLNFRPEARRDVIRNRRQREDFEFFRHARSISSWS